MASTPKISHVINGYSRYDIPQNIGFSLTPGLLYVGRCQFLNPKDAVNIKVGAVLRTEPSVVPTFTPYQVRLHRFFVPMSLYHPEMRVNSANFDMEELSCNTLFLGQITSNAVESEVATATSNYVFHSDGLLTQLCLASGRLPLTGLPVDPPTDSRAYPAGTSLLLGDRYVNADPLLAYWDIVRNYYAFSQTGQFQIATVGETLPIVRALEPTTVTVLGAINDNTTCKYCRYQGDLTVLDRYYETSFYPRDDDASRFFDRSDLGLTLINAVNQNNFNTGIADSGKIMTRAEYLAARYSISDNSKISMADFFNIRYPLAVVPSAPDRLARTLRPTAGTDVSIAQVNTVRQLAVASRMQQYQDLRLAGGTRFSDWGEVFFGAKIQHIDRPLLVYSATEYLNSSPIFNQQGQPGEGLGAYGGIMDFQGTFGDKAQYYRFDEPGYLMDLVSVRPLYYWSGIQADYARYDGLDYFNPVFNEVGYQTQPTCMLGIYHSPSYPNVSLFKEPCYNEFRASYDYVFGDFMKIPYASTYDKVRTAWVQQRVVDFTQSSVYTGYKKLSFYMDCTKFVDLATVNQPFASNLVDNMFINLYYSVSTKSLVSKMFATRLGTR